MKKNYVLFDCFAGLFFAVWMYLDIYLELQSIYWLVIKWVCFPLIISGWLLIDILRKKVSKGYIILRICYGIFFVGFYGYHDISKYKRNVCQDKFGREFNERRRRLGVPEIPVEWHVKFRGNYSVDWTGKDTTGHVSKDIEINSSCVLDYEIDEYNLKAINGISRDMSIKTRYANGKGKDSIFYFYETGGDNHLISGRQADSIFAAEKFNKDY
jgi:hypothetical protein